MSAFVVDRKDIRYLINAGLSRVLEKLPGNHLRWFWQHNGNQVHMELTRENSAEIGQMLWDENVTSVRYCYPDNIGDELPGPIGEDYKYRSHSLDPMRRIDPIQVLKTCDCFAYQSCEHPEWKDSQAKAFIDALRARAWSSLPGYEQAKWGSP